MKLKVNILEIKTVNEFDFYWKPEDYLNLLKEFGFPDAHKSKPEDWLELLFMAIGDFEPDEAARVLLNYKLGDTLNEGQILTISHDMMIDKVAEEYPEPALHLDLFCINQLLYKAYNGTFLNTEASIIEIEFKPDLGNEPELKNEIIVKALSKGLSPNNLINRLFEDQIVGNEPFSDASKTLWKINKTGENTFQLITSKYWVDKEDFIGFEYEAEIQFYVEED